MSPHLSVWRWHLTMFCSILNRATGVALYGGLLILAAWAVALASGPDAYALVMGLLGSLLGKLVMLGLTFSLLFHLAGGIRHLVWDAGKGFTVKTVNTTSIAEIVFALVASVAVWIIAAMMGAL